MDQFVGGPGSELCGRETELHGNLTPELPTSSHITSQVAKRYKWHSVVPTLKYSYLNLSATV